jgi:hypothetical protein
MKRMRAALAVAVLGITALLVDGGAPVGAGATPKVRLNEMQVIGSHNSYHIEPPVLAPVIDELAYTHAPLPEQFTSQGVRQIELDIFHDPTGNLWRPFGVPGYKVMHIEQIDELSTCETLVICLTQVKAWSDDHDQHMPIAILLESKDTIDLPGGPDPLPIGPAELDVLDAEIRSIFPEDRIITPDDVRDGAPTLEEAVLDQGWPEIDDVRGQVLFLLDNKRDEYRAGHPSLEGRVAFTPSFPGQPDAAFVKRNDPLGANTAQIQELVAAGYVVRTRADEPVFHAQNNDTTMRDAALASGAQWVSTDFPVPGMAARWNGSTYVAQIPGGTPARCNPVNAPPGCVNTDIENLQLPQAPPSAPTTPSSAPVPATNVATAPRFTG